MHPVPSAFSLRDARFCVSTGFIRARHVGRKKQMADKYQNKYRIASARLQNWDYGWNAAYFITICTQNRKCYLGDVVETCRDVKFCVYTEYNVSLSEIGEIARQYWLGIPRHYPFVQLGEFVVMPNHIHGILIIDKPDGGRDAIVETQDFASQPTQPPQNRFGPQSQNISSIIRGYKSGVKKYTTMNKIDFAWQSRFYDHIIRNAESYNKIQNYINNNPINWKDDELYPKCSGK